MKMPADHNVPVDPDYVSIFVVGATPPGLQTGWGYIVINPPKE